MNLGTVTDDSTIRNDEVIWRRVHEYQVVYDDNLKRKRPSSASFNQDGKENPVSVYIASEAISSQTVMQGGKEKFLVSLPVSSIRQLGLGIIRDSSTGSPGHALLIGRKTGSMLNRMVKAASWVSPYAP